MSSSHTNTTIIDKMFLGYSKTYSMPLRSIRNSRNVSPSTISLMELHVGALPAGAVAFTLRAASGSAVSPWTSPWLFARGSLWVLAALCVGAWHAKRPPASTHMPSPDSHQSVAMGHGWLYAAGGAALAALLLQSVVGSAVVEESVVAIPTRGVQLTRRTRSGATAKRFIPLADVSAVVVNEAFRFSDVVYSIAFMLHGSDRMVLAFEHFQPRVAVLQEVFIGLQRSLFPDHTKMHLPHQ